MKEDKTSGTKKISTEFSISRDKVSTVHDIWLPDSLDTLSDTTEVLKMLHGADVGDVVNLHIGGVGGDVELGLRIIRAIYQCAGRVNNIIEAPVYSMHSVIAVNGFNFQLNPEAFFNFHSMTYLAVGKKHEVKECVKFTDAWAESLNRKLLSHILTAEELAAINRGKELYLSAQQMKPRFKKLIEKRNKKGKKE